MPRWINGNPDKIADWWIAEFTKEGAESLGRYIDGLRQAYREAADDEAYKALCVRSGKKAKAAYSKAFGSEYA